MNDVIAVTLAIALVGVVLFLVLFYLSGPHDVDQSEERRFDLEDVCSDREDGDS